MKRTIALLLLLSTPCFAKVDISIMGGGAFPTGEVKAGDNKDDMGKAGGAAGLQVMVPVTDQFSVGIDILNHTFGEKTSDTVLPGTRATYKFNAASFLLGGRLQLPKDKLRPYIFAGMGLGQSSGWADIQPNPGLIWTDTGTAEKRRILDDSGTAFAAAGAIGLDCFLNDLFSLGIESRYTYIGKTTYTTNSISRVVSTVDKVEADPSVFSLLVRASLHF